MGPKDGFLEMNLQSSRRELGREVMEGLTLGRRHRKM